MGVFHPHLAGIDALDAVRRVPELEHVAGQALDREVFVHGADRNALRLEQHRIVGIVGDGAARGDGGELATAPATHGAAHGVAVQVGAAHSLARGVAFREHAQHRVETVARQVRIRPGLPHQRKQLVLAPFAAGHFCHDVLGQHVERRHRHVQDIEFVAAHAVEQRRAFHQVVARGGKQPALGQATHVVTGAAHALQKGCDAARGTDLAHQIDVADVDAQLQRGGGHQHPQLAALEALLGVQPVFLGQAAVVRGDVLAPQAVGQVARHPFGHAPGIDEHQRGAVQDGQLRQLVVHALPHFVGHHRFQRHRRQFQSEVARAHVAHVHHRAILAGTGQEVRHRGQRLLGGRQADAHRRRIAQGVEPFQAQ